MNYYVTFSSALQFTLILFQEIAEASKRHVTKANPYGQTTPTISATAAKAMAEIHFLCGKSLMENWQVKEAIEQFGSVLDLVPNHVKVSNSF